MTQYDQTPGDRAQADADEKQPELPQAEAQSSPAASLAATAATPMPVAMPVAQPVNRNSQSYHKSSPPTAPVAPATATPASASLEVASATTLAREASAASQVAQIAAAQEAQAQIDSDRPTANADADVNGAADDQVTILRLTSLPTAQPVSRDAQTEPALALASAQTQIVIIPPPSQQHAPAAADSSSSRNNQSQPAPASGSSQPSLSEHQKAANRALYATIKTGDILKFHRGPYVHFGIADCSEQGEVFCFHLWSRTEQMQAGTLPQQSKPIDMSNLSSANGAQSADNQASASENQQLVPSGVNRILFLPDRDAGYWTQVRSWSQSFITQRFGSVGSGGNSSAAMSGVGIAQPQQSSASSALSSLNPMNASAASGGSLTNASVGFSDSVVGRNLAIGSQSVVGAATGSVGITSFAEIDSAFVQRTRIGDVHGISAISIDSSSHLNTGDGNLWPAADPETILARCRAELDKRGYNLLTNNCEHWSNEMKFGVAHSEQISSMVRRASSLAASAITILSIAGTATAAGPAMTAAGLATRLGAGASVSKLVGTAAEMYLNNQLKARNANNNAAAAAAAAAQAAPQPRPNPSQASIELAPVNPAPASVSSAP